ncbi:MAG: hypothetical protein IJD49_10410 [Clostridia bacterium]|nr:hypothetical protein [Clostridia bacterium]
MVDFHSHILPQMDDGSSGVEESFEMLSALARQGVETVIATPHFYANDESVSDFLARREKSFAALNASVGKGLPDILLGAEVKYYEGISRMAGLEALCIGNTGLLLLEMPMKRWTEYTLRELIDISCSGKIILVLAHVERYLSFQSSGTIDYLLKNGILLQINAGFLCGTFSKRKALGLLKRQAVHFIGSDCHNMSDRPPDIGRAYEIIRKKLGNDFSQAFINFAKDFLNKN